MKEISTTEKTMTVRQVALVLTVSKDTVLNCIKRIMPNKLQRGKKTELNEAEVSLVSKELKHNSYSMAKQTVETVSIVKNVTTEREENETIANAMLILKRRSDEYKHRAEIAENKNTELLIQLGESKYYITVKRMEALNKGKCFEWRALKAESIKLNILPKDTFDQNYGSVKAYHVKVWESLYFDGINYPTDLEGEL
jgi:hypothetical protein